MVWPVPFEIAAAEEAMRWFLDRDVMTGDELDALRGEVSRKAFWLRRVTQARIVEEVYASLSKAIEGGMGPREWEREIGPSLLAKWTGAGAARPEIVIRNWTAQAYSQERRKALLDPVVVKQRPYWLFDGVADSRQSEVCALCDGVVARADDPWWQTHTPPLHHQCRSGIISLDAEDVKELGDVRAPGRVAVPDGWGNPDKPWDPADQPPPEL